MKTYVMLPTYNERDNIVNMLEHILSLNIPDLYIIVVDDNSPDGTHEMVSEFSKSHKNVELLVRTEGRGRGSAGIAGFKYAIENNADYVIEMDADFSHHPKYIPAILEAAKDYDLVLGSRFAESGQDAERSKKRQLITKLAGFYVRSVLGVPVKDVSSGYRCFRRSILEKIGMDTLFSTGPSIVSEILFKAHLKGASIKEVPIHFFERREGDTKLNIKILLKSLLIVLKLKYLHVKGTLFTDE